MAIPVIDIFAGPGGLGEGFCSLLNDKGERLFKIALSIEKEYFAHRTLTLRSFFRQFKNGEVPSDYYEFVKGNIKLEQLYSNWPSESNAAKEEAWQAELGEGGNSTSNSVVDEKISNSLKGRKNWLLIGGPPCQAYSSVGRSRRKEKFLDGKKDKRVGLYKQYLRILAVHVPTVFVMENVKGLLSAKTEESPIFSKILNDLTDPEIAYASEFGKDLKKQVCSGYKIFSLVVTPKSFDILGYPVIKHKDFVIRSEDYGIPQTRHRVILLGIRKDIDCTPAILEKKENISISKVLSGLPRLRSRLSKVSEDEIAWKEAIIQIRKGNFLNGADKETRNEIFKQLGQISLPHKGSGAEYLPYKGINIDYRSDWFLDDKIQGVCNHFSRGHMESDLLRYFFVACYAKIHDVSPKLEDFPPALLPDHENVDESIKESKFSDRFRAQLWNKPSKTITSHISKDGHYYIHPDPTQCRSFTVREAARIQTFPDNYYFSGQRTSQFAQVGNAVPPLLANKIAAIVSPIFKF